LFVSSLLFLGCPMTIDPFTERGALGPEATAAMGEAFDAACEKLRSTSEPEVIRERIARLIIGAASRGELDPIRLRKAALAGFTIFRPRGLNARNCAFRSSWNAQLRVGSPEISQTLRARAHLPEVEASVPSPWLSNLIRAGVAPRILTPAPAICQDGVKFHHQASMVMGVGTGGMAPTASTAKSTSASGADRAPIAGGRFSPYCSVTCGGGTRRADFALSAHGLRYSRRSPHSQ
jgi:hypothetical protein